MSDVHTIGPARLCEKMLDDTPQSVVAIWQSSDGKWYRSWWFNGNAICADVMGQLQLAGLRIYDEAFSGEADG